MLFSSHKNLEDTLVERLLHGQRTAKVLLRELEELGHSYTIQAIYLALKDLIRSEAIIKVGFYYRLNEEWKNKTINILAESSGEISDGEKTILILNSLSNYDLQWKNTILPLHNKYPEDPIFFYNYHYIWIHLGETREESELDYYKSFEQQKRYAFSLVGSHSPLEVETKKMIENDYVRIFIDDKPIQSTGYITIINDYIITSYLQKKTIQEIEECYKRAQNIPELRRLIQKIDFKIKRVKIVIERDKEKAKKLRKKMAKDFYVPKELKEKFDLF
jgi:hypothetical protein